MNNVQKSTEKYEIIDSGCLILPAGEILVFTIMNVTFKIIFKDEDGDAKLTKIGNGFELTLHKQDDANFSGTPEMVKLGSINGRNIYIILNVKATTANPCGGNNKIIFYTWYIDRIDFAEKK